jgi:hypothetical protein
MPEPPSSCNESLTETALFTHHLCSTAQDIVDSDFDEPEDVGEADDEQAAAKEERQQRTSSARGITGKYVDPALRPKKAPGQPAAKRAKIASAHAEPVEVNVDRSSLRRSTKAASAKADKVRNARHAEMEERRLQKREREKNKVPDKILTQEEMLAEAKVTAVENAKDLDALLRLEEERKRQPLAKTADPGPRMSVISKASGTVIAFLEKNADARAAMFPHCEPVASKPLSPLTGNRNDSSDAAYGMDTIADDQATDGPLADEATTPVAAEDSAPAGTVNDTTNTDDARNGAPATATEAP